MGCETMPNRLPVKNGRRIGILPVTRLGREVFADGGR
jgi:hypothetical protein